MTCADMNCNCKDGHQQAGGEVSAASRTTSKWTGWRMGGEGRQVEQEEPEAEEARTGRNGRFHRVHLLHECRNPH